jgi:hypothetical protein
MKSEILKKLCDNRRYVGITRDIPDTDRIWGIVLALSRNLVLVQNVTDFHLDGYSIIRRCDISKVIYRKDEKCYEKILKKEGLFNKVGLQEKILLNNWLTVFHSLKRIGRNVIVEGECPDIDEYCIGRIIRVNKKHVKMQYFDSTGKWTKGFWHAPYDEITIVQFESEYVKVFSKYLRPLK